jgi:hypothetical protein
MGQPRMTAKPGKKLRQELVYIDRELDVIGNLQESLAANSLHHLSVVGLSRLLGDGNSLKRMSFHGPASISHSSEKRELAALDSAGGRSDNDGRHVD